MALYKQIISDNGIVTYYHRIRQIYLDKNGKLDILVYSYANEFYRKEEPGETDSFDYIIASKFYYANAGSPSISYEEAYNLLKQMDEFEGALDVD